MATIQEDRVVEADASPAGQTDMKLEVVVLPVSDVDRAADFYARLGWRVDVDLRAEGVRILQCTPPGSPASILFGTGLSPAAPGSAQYLHLIVPDIEAATRDLAARGVETSGVFHDSTGGFNRFDPRIRARGPDPERRSYGSFATSGDQCALAGPGRFRHHGLCVRAGPRGCDAARRSGAWRIRTAVGRGA
jgi:catechol 2,3-dioxygenase-like lactoylglutathione lyase family enzyme